MAELEYRILGPLEVLTGRRSVPLGGAKQRAVLALLLLEANRAVSTERLIDDLWPERAPGRPQTAVQGYVSELRKLFEPERGPGDPFRVLKTEGPGYVLRVEPEQLDLHRFEHLLAEGKGELAAGRPEAAARLLHEALSLWRGPALADFTYEPWAQGAIARLDELRLACLEERIEADLAVAGHGELVGELEALIGEHPLRERLRGQLMLALYRAGRQAEALSAYQAARRVLVDELGIDPTPALQALEKRILTQDPSLAVEPAHERVAIDEAAPRSPERAILIVPGERAQLPALLSLGERLAAARESHELLIARLVVTGDALAGTTAELEQERRALAERGIHARVAAFTSADRGADLVRLSVRPEVDMLLVAADPAVLVDGQFGDELTAVLRDAPAHVGVWLTRDELEEKAGTEVVVVPFGGSEHDWAAVEVAAWFARPGTTELRLVGTAVESEAGRRDASRLLADAALLLQRASDVVPKPVLVSPGREGIIEASTGAGLLVVGLSERWQEEGLGMHRWALARTAPVPLLFVRRGLRPSGLAPAESASRYTWSVTELGSSSSA